MGTRSDGWDLRGARWGIDALRLFQLPRTRALVSRVRGFVSLPRGTLTARRDPGRLERLRTHKAVVSSARGERAPRASGRSTPTHRPRRGTHRPTGGDGPRPRPVLTSGPTREHRRTSRA